MNAVERKREFEEQGFTVARGCFSAGEMKALLEAIHLAQPLEKVPSELDKGGLTFKHNLLQQSPFLQQFVSQQKVIDFMSPITGPDIWVRWDQAIAKVPGAPEFPWHQDNGYNRLKQGHFQLWVAMTEINEQTGLLWLQPGSHKRGVRGHSRDGTHQVCEGEPAGAISVKAEPGDVILFSSLLLHRTSPNVGQKPRWAYVVEYMTLDQFDPYIKKPYFIAARGGRSAPEFVTTFRGRVSPRNQLLYLVPRLGRLMPRKVLAGVQRLTGR
jgi:Phytanoyl-CoA dioxygenase (PhyH)